MEARGISRRQGVGGRITSGGLEREWKKGKGLDGCWWLRGCKDDIDDALVIVWADEPRQFPEHTDASGECIHRLSPTK